MLVQFEYGFLPGISILFLKESYGPFARTIYLDELIVAVFVPPVKDILSDYHFLPPASKYRLDCMIWLLAAKAFIGKQLFPEQLLLQRNGQWSPRQVL